MNIHFATPKERKDWDKHILANPDRGNIFQSQELAEQKQLGDWTPRYIVCDELAITVLERFIFGIGKIWYMPKGPGVTSTKELFPCIDTLKTFAKKHGVFVLKIESEISKTDATTRALQRKGLIRIHPIQPNYATVILDISRPLAKVLEEMPQKGSYAIKRAERDGVTAKLVDATDENCLAMFTLMQETAGGRFAIRDYDYYKSFWKRFAQADIGQFHFAYFEGKLVAAAYVMVYGTKATYKDGASVRAKTAYGASHYLQWKAIEWAKKQGAVVYDFCGAPPPERIDDKTHPHYGIGLFKTSFNKEVTEFIGTYDVIVKPRLYKLWRLIGERIAHAWYGRVLHRYFY
jgi:lipid II:glycine glycyltransferase (peptidoglycan interpeptide bridge formation enzyme)